ETAAVLIEVQTKNGMIEETDLQGVIEAERQIVGVDRRVKNSDVADYSLIREVLREYAARPPPLGLPKIKTLSTPARSRRGKQRRSFRERRPPPRRRGLRT